MFQFRYKFIYYWLDKFAGINNAIHHKGMRNSLINEYRTAEPSTIKITFTLKQKPQ